jgi:hypothetical protein
VYGTLDHDSLNELEKDGIRTSTQPLDPLDFDVIIAPVHLDPGYPMLARAENHYRIGIPLEKTIK